MRRRGPVVSTLILTLAAAVSAGAGGPLELTPEQLGADLRAQQQLYETAEQLRGRQQRLGDQILARSGGRGRVRSVLKRASPAALAAAILEKCERNRYARVGQMDDIVRGRFDLQDALAVERVALELQLQGAYPIHEAVGPRRPLPNGGYGYPRWHVTLRDPRSGLRHEWQVGTEAVSEVFERDGIVLPPGVELAREMRPNLHDIDYEVFVAIRRRFPDVHRAHGLPAFHDSVDALAAEAGLRGAETQDLEATIAALHHAAAEQLQRLVDEFGAAWLQQFYR